jgi:hypothetical protein
MNAQPGKNSWQALGMKRLQAVTLLMLSACAPSSDGPGASAPDYLYAWAWARDTTRGSVLAVFDLAPGLDEGKRLVALLPAGTPSGGAHHLEHEIGPDSLLFANAFGPGRTVIFDLRTPAAPSVKASLTDAGPLSHPHSYVRLPNGNRLSTFQWKTGRVLPGGLVEIDTAGKVVRWSIAATPSADSLEIVPYSLAVLPALDRVVSTSTHMIEDIGVHLQVWRLSDLALLHTIRVPLAANSHAHAGHDSTHHTLPGEPRALADGKTVMFGTFTCGLYYLTGLDGENPHIEFSSAFPGANCAVPVVIGKYWIQTVPAINALVALDVTDPAKPVEVSRLTFPSHVHPHWLGADPGGRRLVMSSANRDDPVIRFANFDPANGALSHRTDTISLNGLNWPDGFRGDLVPHGLVFGRR